MRIAETAGSRVMFVISALSTVGLLIAATWEHSPPPPQHASRHVRPMRSCDQARPRAVVPPTAPHRNGHADTLIGAREALSACMRHQTVPVRLALDISADGRVTSVEVKVKAVADGAQLDMHVVKCLDTAASSLVFPRGVAAVRISTHLIGSR